MEYIFKMDYFYKTDQCAIYNRDNIEVMQSLSNNYIDLIYCDILYNTGRKFDDFDDNLGTTQDAIARYKPRLVEMYRILKETGSIYLHMDYRLVHYMKVEMDKIFWENNFQNHIVWCYKSGGATKQRFSRKHNDILFYSKSNNFIFNYQQEKSYNRNFKPYKFKGKDKFWAFVVSLGWDKVELWNIGDNQYVVPIPLNKIENDDYEEIIADLRSQLDKKSEIIEFLIYKLMKYQSQ
jgi:hypothetical protein